MKENLVLANINWQIGISKKTLAGAGEAILNNLGPILDWGHTYNELSPDLFERVWTLQQRREGMSPFPPSIRKEMEAADPAKSELKSAALAISPLGERLDELITRVSTSSIQSGYFVTTSRDGGRARLPIHTHKKVKDQNLQTGWTISFCVRLTEHEVAQKILFYDSSVDEFSGLQFGANPAESIPLSKSISGFLFRADRIPHTVLFSEDVCLWHVTNCVHLKEEILVDPAKIYQFGQ